MERYDYRDAVETYVFDYIIENIDYADFDDLDDLERYLNDELWRTEEIDIDNAYGIYDCNAWQAEEAIAHNWDLLEEALQELGCLSEAISNGAGWCDAMIRYYLLKEGKCIAAAVEEIEENFKAAHEGEDGEGEVSA